MVIQVLLFNHTHAHTSREGGELTQSIRIFLGLRSEKMAMASDQVMYVNWHPSRHHVRPNNATLCLSLTFPAYAYTLDRLPQDILQYDSLLGRSRKAVHLTIFFYIANLHAPGLGAETLFKLVYAPCGRHEGIITWEIEGPVE